MVSRAVRKDYYGYDGTYPEDDRLAESRVALRHPMPQPPVVVVVVVVVVGIVGIVGRVRVAPRHLSLTLSLSPTWKGSPPRLPP